MPRARVLRCNSKAMGLPSLPRTSLPTTLLAATCGVGLGLVTFVLTAWLHSIGANGAAGLLAETALLVALACVRSDHAAGRDLRRRAGAGHVRAHRVAA